MAPGARSKLGAPMLEPELFRKQIEESTCDICGTFRRPCSDSAPGELCLLAALVTPLVNVNVAGFDMCIPEQPYLVDVLFVIG